MHSYVLNSGVDAATKFRLAGVANTYKSTTYNDDLLTNKNII